MACLEYTPLASTDVDSIWDYIAKDNPEAARGLLRRIDERCRLLAENPYSGTSASDLLEDLRAVTVGSYVIFYFPLPDGDGIRIARILHGARDLPVVLQEGLDDR